MILRRFFERCQLPPYYERVATHHVTPTALPLAHVSIDCSLMPYRLSAASSPQDARRCFAFTCAIYARYVDAFTRVFVMPINIFMV